MKSESAFNYKLIRSKLQIKPKISSTFFLENLYFHDEKSEVKYHLHRLDQEGYQENKFFKSGTLYYLCNIDIYGWIRFTSQNIIIMLIAI